MRQNSLQRISNIAPKAVYHVDFWDYYVLKFEALARVQYKSKQW